MTEAEWFASSDPSAMLSSLGNGVSKRKLRLVAVACCRVWWDRLSDWRCRRAVEVAERYADRAASQDELIEARAGLQRGRKCTSTEVALHATDLTDEHAATNTLHMARFVAAMDASNRTPFSEVALPSEAKVIRCLFGNPSRPVAFEPAWLTETAVAIARGIYDDRAFDRLPILADALQDAGCEDADVLGHCRGDGPHVRGCWVVDGVLGKG